MKKKPIAVILMALCLLTGCSSTQPENSAETTRNSASETGISEKATADTAKTTEQVTGINSDVNTKASEIIDVSEREKKISFYRDDLKIGGRMYLPDGDGPFPAVILSNGSFMTYGSYEELAEEFADNGIAGVVFDFAGTGNASESDGETTDLTVLTEADDLNTVFDDISALPAIDSSNIFLWGHSMGGLVSTYVAEQRPDDIKGLILVEPAYQMSDDVKKQFPEGTEIPEVIQGIMGRAYVEDLISLDIFDKMSDYSKNVIIINGTVNPSVGKDFPELFHRAAETFPSVKIEAVDGANHRFMDEKGHDFTGEKADQMMTKSIEFLKENIN